MAIGMDSRSASKKYLRHIDVNPSICFIVTVQLQLYESVEPLVAEYFLALLEHSVFDLALFGQVVVALSEQLVLSYW